jgi:hypothetical protein
MDFTAVDIFGPPWHLEPLETPDAGKRRSEKAEIFPLAFVIYCHS